MNISVYPLAFSYGLAPCTLNILKTIFDSPPFVKYLAVVIKMSQIQKHSEF